MLILEFSNTYLFLAALEANQHLYTAPNTQKLEPTASGALPDLYHPCMAPGFKDSIDLADGHG